MKTFSFFPSAAGESSAYARNLANCSKTFFLRGRYSLQGALYINAPNFTASLEAKVRRLAFFDFMRKRLPPLKPTPRRLCKRKSRKPCEALVKRAARPIPVAKTTGHWASGYHGVFLGSERPTGRTGSARQSRRAGREAAGRRFIPEARPRGVLAVC